VAELGPGTRLGRYQVDRVIGRRDVADICRAHDERGLPYAVKVFHRGGEEVMRRASLVIGLEHPNIARNYEVFPYGEGFCVVQEWVPGGSLEAELAYAGRLSIEQTLRLGRDLASALGYAHERGILHRDITPANVLRHPDGRYMLVDFGALGQLEHDTGLTRAGQVAGTPYYMSPEQLTGSPQGAASDIFGLGLLLFRAVYGRVPDESADNLLDLLSRRVQQPIEVPQSPLRGLISACLALDPNARPRSAEVLEMLRVLTEQWNASYTASEAEVEDAVPPPLTRPSPPRMTTTSPPATTSPGQGQWQLPVPSYGPSSRSAGRRGVVVGAGVVALVAVVVLASVLGASWTGIVLVANGVLIAAAGVAVARWLRRRWSARSDQVGQDVSRVLFSATSRADLSRSLMIEVNAMMASLQTIDQRLLGKTVVAFIDEYEKADASADRQSALLGMVSVLEKVEKRLAPWHVRHRDAIATAIAVVGCVAGVVSAVQPFLG
jgi:hypothetical protein